MLGGNNALHYYSIGISQMPTLIQETKQSHTPLMSATSGVLAGLGGNAK